MNLDDALVLDIETVGEPWDGRVLVCGLEERPSVPAAEFGLTDAQREILVNPLIPLITHTKYDARYLRLAGQDVDGEILDTQTMAWVLNENTPLDLESLVYRYCGVMMDKRIKRVGGKLMFLCDDGRLVPLEDAPPKELLAYNIRDLAATRLLFNELRRLLTEQMWDEYWLTEEVPFTEVLLGMEVAGMPVDLEAAAELRVNLSLEAETRKANLLADAGLPSSFNIGSGDQLAAYLFNRRFELRDAIPITPEQRGLLKLSVNPETGAVPANPDILPKAFDVGKIGRAYAHGVWNLKGLGLAKTPKAEKKPRPRTDSKSLIVLHGTNEWVQNLIQWRKLNKVVTTYLDAFPRFARNEHGETYDDSSRSSELGQFRLYPRFNQTGTVTGRLSSAQPNAQNMPAHGELGEAIRKLFVGDLVVGDYSQLEPRLMAHFSQDPVLLGVYREQRDLYITIAEGVLGQTVEKDDPVRQMFKTYVLALGYGAGYRKLSEVLAINGFPTSVDRVKETLEELERLLAGFFEWKQQVIAYAHHNGYVSALAGRHRRLRAAFRDRWNYKAIGYGERQAVNAIIQGSAGDIVRRAMVQWPYYVDKCGGYLTLLAQVHDELLWEYDREHFGRGDAGGGEYHEGWPSYYLAGLKNAAEEPAEHFGLTVPLVFEPQLCQTWAEKGKGAVDWSTPDEEEDEAI